MWIRNDTKDVNDSHFINEIIKCCETPLYDFHVTFSLSNNTLEYRKYIQDDIELYLKEVGASTNPEKTNLNMERPWRTESFIVDEDMVGNTSVIKQNHILSFDEHKYRSYAKIVLVDRRDNFSKVNQPLPEVLHKYLKT